MLHTHKMEVVFYYVDTAPNDSEVTLVEPVTTLFSLVVITYGWKVAKVIPSLLRCGGASHRNPHCG